MKLFKMGELDEGADMLQSRIGLWWYENVTDIPPGIHLMTVLLTFVFPRLGTHYDIMAREVRYGWWLHWVCFYREDSYIARLPRVGIMTSKQFHKEK